MKTRFGAVLLGLLLVTAGASAIDGIFSFLRATPQNDDILVQWRSANESGVQYYDVERRSEEANEFRRLGRIAARGAGSSYTFLDDEAFYKPQAGRRFTYRIRALGNGTDQYSPTTTVIHEVSSVRRSWGMIKELFR
jgi:hypothetical protein